MPLSLKFKAPIAQSTLLTPTIWRVCSFEEFAWNGEAGLTYSLSGTTHYLALYNFELENGEIVVDDDAKRPG